MTRKILSILLAVMLFVSIFPLSYIPAYAVEPEFDYTLDEDNNAIITGYNGNEVSITVPSAIDNYDVIEIGDSAFYGNKALEKVTIRVGIKHIGISSFEDCTNLKEVSLPYTMQTIDIFAFKDCINLYDCDIPSNTTHIGYGAFENCESLADVAFPNGIESIGNYAFRNTGIVSILIPESIKTIPRYAFADCKDLVSVSLRFGTQRIETGAFEGCTALTEITIRDYIAVEKDAFKGCTNLSKVVIEQDVTILDNGAFPTTSTIYGCAGSWAESYATTNGNPFVSIPANVRYQYSVISETKKTIEITGTSSTAEHLLIPSEIDGYTVTSIGMRAFEYNDYIKTVSFPATLTEISVRAFNECSNLERVTIPGTVKIINQGTFSNSPKLQEIIIEYGATEIIEWAFMHNTALERVVIPGSVKTIGNEAFTGCSSLTDVVMGEGIRTLNSGVFKNCTSLKEIKFPASVSSIKYDVFTGCTAMENFVFAEGNTTYSAEDGVIYNADKTKLIKCLIQKGDTLEIPSTVTYIGESALEGCSSFKKITIPSSVTLIMANAFSGCTSLKEITIPGTVTTIAGHAFKNCTALEKVIIKDGVESVLAYAFKGCTNLKIIVIPESVTSDMKQSFEPTMPLTVYGYADSTAETAAEYYGFTFVDMSDAGNEYDCSLNGHTFGEWETIQYVTCAQEGINVRTCETCGETEEDIIPKKTDHAFEEQEFVPPTCTSDGYLTMKCWICGFTDTIEEYEATGHTDLNNNGLCDVCEEPNFVTVSGKCGDNLTWEFNEFNGTLTISGTGAMYDFEYDPDNRPWASHKEDIKTIVIDNGVTTIGNWAFFRCTNLESMTIPNSVITIGENSIRYCISLTSITIPDSVTTIGVCAFFTDDKLTDVYYFGTENQWKKISIENYNEPLLKATIHYNYIDPNKFTGVKGDYFYKNDVRLNAYQLVEFDGDFYFINDSHKIAKNKMIYLGEKFIEGFTFADGTPLTAGYYNFDEDGKMIILNGPVGDYFYKNGLRLNAYQLVEFDGDFYFINDSHKLAKNKKIYLSEKFIEGFTFADGTPLTAGYYSFDEDGKMIILNGPVGDYFYKNNVRLNAYQLVAFEGNYYFVNDSHKIAKSTKLYLRDRFVEGFTFEDGTPLHVGYYEFDADGKMIILNGPVGDYFYENNVRLSAYQLVEYEGNYYFINDSHKLAKDKTIYLSARFVEDTSLEVGYYAFDADGKLIIQ